MRVRADALSTPGLFSAIRIDWKRVIVDSSVDSRDDTGEKASFRAEYSLAMNMKNSKSVAIPFFSRASRGSSSNVFANSETM